MEERQRHHATAKKSQGPEGEGHGNGHLEPVSRILRSTPAKRTTGGGAAGPRASWMVSNRNGFLALFLAASLVMTRPDHAAFKRAFKKAAKER